jgi:hypothetical protein
MPLVVPYVEFTSSFWRCDVSEPFPQEHKEKTNPMFKKLIGGIALVGGLIVAGVVGFRLIDSPFTTVTSNWAWAAWKSARPSSKWSLTSRKT